MESAELLLPTDADTSPPAPFFIPASASLEDGRPRTLKHADSFAVFDQHGDIVAGPGSPEGLYHRDTRYLSQLSLTLAGMQPILLSSTLRDDNATLTSDLTNPAVRGADGQVVLRHDLIHLRRTCFLWKANCFQRVCVRNFSLVPQHVCLELSFAADFADLFEVRGTPRARRGRLHHPQVDERQVLIAYTGLDRVRRETLLRFDPAPAELTAGRAIFDFTLAPRQAQVLYVQVSCGGTPLHVPTKRSFFTALRDARRSLRASSSRAVVVSSSNEIFNEAARRSLSDLYMLITDTPEGPYPYAGIPWYSTVFGRDALITALETLWLDPAIARGVLRYLAANQATMVDAAADAEPGKILHEVRHGEMALLGEVPFRRYYGSIDATPLFVMLAGAYLDRTGDIETVRQLQPNIEAALQWIDRYGDRDGDGFVEYGRRTDSGLANQGWKDSDDSVFHADGHLANGPIALAEVQAYVYGAWRAAAAIARRLGEAARAQTLEHRALDLQARFDECFFDDTLGSYVLALDGDKQPCRVRASNAGHALYTGIAYPERAARVVATLMTSSSFSGWGIRTVATTEARYNPISYHNGSVWPHDNALIAAGFARYGFREAAARIFEGLFAASTYIDLRRLPELFCGFPRLPTHGPTFYPVACIPQAWAAATPLSLLQSCLGLGFGARELVLDAPVLPEFLDELVLRHLRVGSGQADIALRRAGSRVVVQVLDRRGDIRVISIH